jgi:hypothetical protein
VTAPAGGLVCDRQDCRACRPALTGTGVVAVHQPPVRCGTCGTALGVAYPQHQDPPPRPAWFHAAGRHDHPPLVPVTPAGTVLAAGGRP